MFKPVCGGMIETLVSWLNSLPAWQLALVLCALYLVVTLVGIVLIHPLMRRLSHSARQANDVVIFAAANYGLIYAVLLGLLTVATFHTTKDLEDHIAEEASSLSTMYHSAEDYPEPRRSELRADLRDDTHYMIEKDWPATARRNAERGRTPARGHPRDDYVSWDDSLGLRAPDLLGRNHCDLPRDQSSTKTCTRAAFGARGR
jgi:hypothetical protein